MARFVSAAVVVLVALFVSDKVLVEADEGTDTRAVLDKAIQALGGEANLAKIKTATWKSKGTISFGDNDNAFTGETTVAGLDRYRTTFEGEFGGNKVKGLVVLAGDKGWRLFGDNKMEMDKDAIANEKRTLYLQVLPMVLLPLREKDFKVEAAGEEKVGGKPAIAVKVTPKDGKSFRLAFDKQSGLPLKLVAKVAGFMGDEFTQETTFADYKDFKGIKRATRIESKRDGEKFLDVRITEFRRLDKVDEKIFSAPE